MLVSFPMAQGLRVLFFKTIEDRQLLVLAGNYKTCWMPQQPKLQLYKKDCS
jgi:hypothetical protein